MALNKLFFPKTLKNFKKLPIASGDWGPRSQAQSVIHLLTFVSSPHLLNLTHILKTLSVGLSPPPLATSCLRTNPSPWLLFILRYFCPIKNSFFWKFLMTSNCMWFADWDPPNQKSWLWQTQNSRNFYVWLFSFSTDQKQCCLRAEDRVFLRTSRVRGQGLKLRDQS